MSRPHASRPDAVGHRQAVPLIESFRRFRLSCWDAAIVEASRTMGCTQVLSGDLRQRPAASAVAGHVRPADRTCRNRRISPASPAPAIRRRPDRGSKPPR